MTDTTRIRMVLPQSLLPAFAALLQRGVWLRARVGCSVLELLTTQLGVARDYVEERITTLFVDSKAIDGLETTYVKNGSVVALSAAMPGLVGATMRRGGHLAAMRGNITYHAPQQHDSGDGRVRVKLFNMVLYELGGLILQHGIELQGAELADLLAAQTEEFWQGCRDICWDEQPLDADGLRGRAASLTADDEVLLHAEIRD